MIGLPWRRRAHLADEELIAQLREAFIRDFGRLAVTVDGSTRRHKVRAPQDVRKAYGRASNTIYAQRCVIALLRAELAAAHAGLEAELAALKAGPPASGQGPEAVAEVLQAHLLGRTTCLCGAQFVKGAHGWVRHVAEQLTAAERAT